MAGCQILPSSNRRKTVKEEAGARLVEKRFLHIGGTCFSKLRYRLINRGLISSFGRDSKMIVVDGRTDIEKLHELLDSAGESGEVDFKETLDLNCKTDELHFVKDAVSMFNRYPGGYLIIGATNNGKPSERSSKTDWDQFDATKLANKIARYVDAPLHPISAIHEIDGHTFCLICFMSPPDGLPVPFNRLGQYLDQRKNQQVVVFREGEISRRDGAQNGCIKYDQWANILKQHDALVRDDESNRINALVDKIISVLGEKGKTPPLITDMNESALARALSASFEQEENPKLSRFVNQLSLEMNQSVDAITKITAVATHALSYGNDRTLSSAIDALYDYYYGLNCGESDTATQKLSVAICAYEIGAVMVLTNRWDLISPFVTRKSPIMGHYAYASWIRDCQVESVQNGSFGDKGSGMLISLALNHAKRHPIVMPDIDLSISASSDTESELSDADNLLLDLLCSFDFIYCLCVTISGDGFGGAYPSCSAFSERRIKSVLPKIFGDRHEVRRALFPGKTDDAIADGLQKVYKLISEESMRKERSIWGFDTTGIISQFLSKHRH